jgi:hypothetical protein
MGYNFLSEVQVVCGVQSVYIVEIHNEYYTHIPSQLSQTAKFLDLISFQIVILAILDED